MRRFAPILIAAGLWSAPPAVAQPAAPASGEVVLLAAGSPLEIAVSRVPLPPPPGSSAPAPAPLTLSSGSPAPPPGWPTAALGGAPLRAPIDGAPGPGCTGCSAANPAATERVAALFATARFRAGPELDGCSHVRLALRANDGAVVWLNGREVARRRIARGGDPLAPAARRNGPEWETFYLPRSAVAAGDNLLAIEVRPAAGSAGPLLDVALSGRRGVAVVRGPVLQDVVADRARIVFDTDLPTRAAVEVTIDGQTRTLASAGGGLAVHHGVLLTGLRPSARVRYRLLVEGAAGEEFAFSAAPAADQVARIAVYGDSRNGHLAHGRLVEAMLGEAPDLVLVTGDLVARGSDEADWQRFFAVAGDLLARVPYVTAAGNHDLGATGDEERRLDELFGLPAVEGRPPGSFWYSIDVGGIHIVALDSNAYGQPAQEAWLRRDLAAARAAGARAILVAVHHGPYSRGPHGGSAIALERYVPILVEGGVDLLFAGHDHIYMRGARGGLSYFVAGGGGAPLYPIACGVAGKPGCKVPDGAAKAASEHHYILLTVDQKTIEACPRRPDRSPLEPCVRYRLKRR